MKRDSGLFRSGMPMLLAAWVLIASAMTGGAMALSIFGDIHSANLSAADFRFEYTPRINGEYALYAFSEDGGEVTARARIYEGEELLAEGEGRGELCGAWLAAGTSYTVRVSGSGQALLEMARCTLSRCFGDPLEADAPSVGGKLLAREGDAHWYRFMAMTDGEIAITCVPEGEMHTDCMLFSGEGDLLAEGEDVHNACLLRTWLRAGDVCCLRISAPEGGTGYYRLEIASCAGGSVAFSEPEQQVAAGGALNLGELVTGEVLLWASGDPAVARVSQEGIVYALTEGETDIFAYGAEDSAACRMQVYYVPLEDIRITAEHITLAVGDDAQIDAVPVPENASDRTFVFSTDSDILEVDASGVLRALGEGEACVTVTDASGEITASVTVTVTAAPVRYRALLLSEQNYTDGALGVRMGSEASALALESLLATVRFPEAAYVTCLLADASRAEFIAALRETFSRATARDVSLVYITCHGAYAGGMSYLTFTDGSEMSARDLERELRRIPGRVVLLLDCCAAGGVLGETGDDFTRGVAETFSCAAVTGSKYLVLCSAGALEDSYRLAFNDGDTQGMYTAFVRALCDGAGWNIGAGTRGAMGADRDFDGQITFGELAWYVRDRVDSYMRRASELTGETYRQTVRAYPEGDALVLFEFDEEALEG